MPDEDLKKSVTGVSLNKTTTSIKVGATETLTSSVTPADATDKTGKWTSDKTAIATIDVNGKVTAVAEGTANITFTTTDGSFTAKCAVTVTAA
ncbi:Ig-like domain-containing protein [Latilactobacillus sakei]